MHTAYSGANADLPGQHPAHILTHASWLLLLPCSFSQPLPILDESVLCACTNVMNHAPLPKPKSTILVTSANASNLASQAQELEACFGKQEAAAVWLSWPPHNPDFTAAALSVFFAARTRLVREEKTTLWAIPFPSHSKAEGGKADKKGGKGGASGSNSGTVGKGGAEAEGSEETLAGYKLLILSSRAGACKEKATVRPSSPMPAASLHCLGFST